jgi:protein subunit release factor B
VRRTAGTQENFLSLKGIEAKSLCDSTCSLVTILPTAPFTKNSRDQTGISVVAVCSTQGGHDKIATVGTRKHGGAFA